MASPEVCRLTVHASWYAIHALATVLRDRLAGASVLSAWTQHRDELRIAFHPAESPEPFTLVVCLKPVLVFVTPGFSMPRKNAFTVFREMEGVRVREVEAALHDRHLFLHLADGRTLHAMLFGPRANVFLVREGVVEEAFLAGNQWEEEPAPTPRPAVMPETEVQWLAWQTSRPKRLWPLFDAVLDAEARHHAASRPLFNVLSEIHEALSRAVNGYIYRLSDGQPYASLLPLAHLPPEALLETFEHHERLWSRFARLSLFETRTARTVAGWEARLERAYAWHSRRAEELMEALSTPGRAVQHEQAGHLLMANAHLGESGATVLEVEDGFNGGMRSIPLDPALSLVQNAQAYYDRARRLRAARAHAETRFEQALKGAETAQIWLERVRAQPTLDGIKALEPQLRDVLPALDPRPTHDDARLPFFRVPIGFGLEAWIGRSASDNDALTLRHARPFDLWLHARDVAGSHVVVRKPNRTFVVPQPAQERAAALAAWFSKARTQTLAPVTVTERKWVRKGKGMAPGAVRVERERVLLVAPAAPDTTP